MPEQPLPIRFPSDDEISMMVNAVASGFGELSEIIGRAGLDLEAMCRFTPLGKILVVARERQG